jgi:hypothetical protein
MSSSFTVWYKKRKDEHSPPVLELHINLWVNINNNDQIDFGLMVENPNTIRELYIYVPFIIEIGDIVNLIQVLSKDKKSSDLVFNGNMTLGDHIGELQKVKREGKAFNYYLIEPQILDKLDGADLPDGRIMKYVFDDSLGNDPVYIRFRINNINQKGLLERHEKSVSYLTGSYNTLTSLEVNFNEFRKLPDNIYQKAHYHHVKISLVNLFVMTDIHMEHVFSNIKNVKSRILEKEKWEAYNPQLKKVKNNKILAYQFKKSREEGSDFLNEFSIFSKFNDAGAKRRYVLFAITIAFALGTLGSLSSSYIEDEYKRLDFNSTLLLEMTKNFFMDRGDK